MTFKVNFSLKNETLIFRKGLEHKDVKEEETYCTQKNDAFIYTLCIDKGDAFRLSGVGYPFQPFVHLALSHLGIKAFAFDFNAVDIAVPGGKAN
jgi:hypothetical protein